MGIVKKENIDNKVRCLLNSSNLLETIYDPENKEILITFRGGRVYRYKNVNTKLYELFENSESHGSTFHKLFKSLPTTRLNDIDTTTLLSELSANI